MDADSQPQMMEIDPPTDKMDLSTSTTLPSVSLGTVPLVGSNDNTSIIGNIGNMSDMSDISEDTVTLVSTDEQGVNGQSFLALMAPMRRLSKTVDDLIKEAGEGHPVPLKIPEKYLKLIIEFCVHYKNFDPNAKPDVEDPVAQLPDPNHVLKKPYEMDAWEKEWTKEWDMEMFSEMALHSSYLDIKKLLRLTCRAWTIHTFVGKTKDEIYKAFGVPEDQRLTQEEEEEIIKEHYFLQDK